MRYVLQARRGIVLGVVALVAGVLAAAPASANATCYDGTTATEVTGNLTLSHDVGPCIGHGLVVTASNVTIDLNGHQVVGDGNAAENNAGILLDGVSGVTVKNGTITAFNAGVAIEGGSSNTVENVTSVGNVGSLLTNYGEGVAVVDSSSNTVKDSKVLGNGPYSGITLLGNSDSNTIDHNVVSGNEVTDGMRLGDNGIRLEQTSSGATDNNIIKRNTVSANLIDGIAVFFGVSTSSDPAATGNEIFENLVEANVREGIRLHASRHPANATHASTSADSNEVYDNTACANGGSGVAVYSHNNTIERNQLGDGALTKAYTGATPALQGPCAPNNPAFSDAYDDHGDCLNNTWGTGANKNTYTTKDPACIP